MQLKKSKQNEIHNIKSGFVVIKVKTGFCRFTVQAYILSSLGRISQS